MQKEIFIAKNKYRKAGMTMVEMIVTFALLSIFMLAATRIITYTATIYYAAKGSSNGMEVSEMVAKKVSGMLEGAINDPQITQKGGAFDEVYFTAKTESVVTITANALPSAQPDHTYLNIHYDAVTAGTPQYEAVDWRFDQKAYLGYTISELRFEDPGAEYPQNVVRMRLTVHSDKYGDFSSAYYIKAANAQAFIYS